MTSIESHPEQYWAAAGRPGPVPLALGPVHPGGPTLIDLLMALFGLSTNADLGGANADIEGDDTDRRAHAADAARKFSANEANAAEQMQGVGAQGMAQMASGIGGALSGALGGVMGPLTQLPQQAMQAGQGAMQPLMSAMQQAQGADGLAAVDGARLLDSIGGEPGLGSGAGGGDDDSRGGTDQVGDDAPARRRFTCLSAHGCGRDADGAAGRDGRPGRRERPRKAGRKARDRACGPQWPAGQGPPDGAPERTDHETHRRQARSSQAHPAARAQGLRTHSSRREDRCR